MEQDSKTMALLFSVKHRLSEIPKLRVYSSNFTEEPGIYIEGSTWKEFIPSNLSPTELTQTLDKVRERSVQ